MSFSYYNTATCDICRRIFREDRRRYYCEHCKEYFFVCKECKSHEPKCPSCGIRLTQKSSPVAIRF